MISLIDKGDQNHTISAFMAVTLNTLQLKDFRNHRSLELVVDSQQLILIGCNAMGKTNIIEALQLTTMLRSFRTSHWQEVVFFGGEQAVIQTDFNQNERRVELELVIREGRRVYSLNDKQRPRDELLGLIPAVLFVPDDLDIVKGPAERRRSMIDGIGQQLSRTYDHMVSEYQRILRQRNRLLREQQVGGRAPALQESWDESLIKSGAQLLVHRLRLFERLAIKIKARYHELSQGEELECVYEGVSSEINNLQNNTREEIEDIYRAQLVQVCADEQIRCRTLVGPHRDEISFTLDKRNARTFGSQGQQRTIALACKLAELDLVREISGNDPLLLLDDVMSELDTHRRAALLAQLNENVCAVITATDMDYLEPKLLTRAQVVMLDGTTPR
ncbi:MAG: DNA replication/repair protein RecF [Coriobacteriales bacterium]|nr:DNA replication/repair protein RecF [Coriobacteriales bacterium]